MPQIVLILDFAHAECIRKSYRAYKPKVTQGEWREPGDKVRRRACNWRCHFFLSAVRRVRRHRFPLRPHANAAFARFPEAAEENECLTKCRPARVTTPHLETGCSILYSTRKT